MSTSTPEIPIAIVGAGFGGICAAIRLKQAGIDSFTLFERTAEFGGTWRDNTYPGAACDVPSHVYSLSFAQSPDWSRVFASSGEIWRYMLDLVERWDLRRHLRPNTAIVGAVFDEAQGSWTLEASDGSTFRARAVFAAVGGLVDPSLPDIEGLDRFEGPLFHTARWDHGCSLAGKRVAVIGTGASAVQVVPALAPEVDRLSVFQRTPAWVIPKLDGEYSERAKWIFRHVPLALRSSRLLLYWMTELFGPVVYLDLPALNALGQRVSLRHLRAQVSDPELRQRLTPQFHFGCKRVLVSNDYWASFERDNVDLVTDPIRRIAPRGVETADGRLHEVDVIVLATGFSVSLTSPPFPVIGRGGRTLEAAWSGGAVAYKGVVISGFPNWFVLMGPNTGPGHTSVLVYTEAQVTYALQAISRLRAGARWLDLRQEVQDRYNRSLAARMPYMSWSSGCQSWYLSDDGSNHSLYPGPAWEYVLRARKLRIREFEVA